MSVSSKTLFLVSIFLLFGSYQSYAGLVIERQTYEESGQKVKGTIYMQDNKIKSFDEAGQFSAIFDLNTGEMIQVDNTSRTYSTTQAKNYFEYYQRYALKMKAAMLQQLSELPPDKRTHAEVMMTQQGIELPGYDASASNIEVKKTGSKKKIAGYESVKYEVYRNGNMVEEIWTSNDQRFQEEIDMNKMVDYLSELRQIEDSMAGKGSLSKDTEEAYIEVFSSGFPMKTIDYQPTGDSIIEETVKVSKKKIDAKEFEAPNGYRKVSLQQMLQLSLQ